VTTSAAGLEVTAPARLRGGLIYQARSTITARRGLHDARLVLDPGWFEQTTVNSIEPRPSEETTDGRGRPVFDLGPIQAGARHRRFVYFQVNPTNVGHRSQTVELRDGDKLVARIDRSVTVFP
jgi:hypothetical protein